jgi:hypothetical protein
MIEWKEKNSMEQQAQASLLKQCKPLAVKLSQQQYEYILDPADLPLSEVYDQVVAQLPDPETLGALEQVERLFEECGITNQERVWLNTWYEMAPAFQEFIASDDFDPTRVYRPFNARLEAILTLTNRLLVEQIIRLGDIDWLSLPAMASENPAILPLAEKLLLNRLAQATHGETAVLPLSAREEALLEYMHARRDELGLASLLPLDTRQPSQEKKAPWIMVTVSAWQTTASFPRGQRPGIWSMQVPRDQVDAVWEKIARATREGKLGKKARVSTARPPKKGQPVQLDHRIDVFTTNAQDTEEAQRVQTVLRELGVTHALTYHR